MVKTDGTGRKIRQDLKWARFLRAHDPAEATADFSVQWKNAIFGRTLNEKGGLVGWRLGQWEYQMTFSTKAAFERFADMIDPDTNPVGWGYDMVGGGSCGLLFDQREDNVNGWRWGICIGSPFERICPPC